MLTVLWQGACQEEEGGEFEDATTASFGGAGSNHAAERQNGEAEVGDVASWRAGVVGDERNEPEQHDERVEGAVQQAEDQRERKEVRVTTESLGFWDEKKCCTDYSILYSRDLGRLMVHFRIPD